VTDDDGTVQHSTVQYGRIAFLAMPLEERKHGKKKDPNKIGWMLQCNATT
jgi:hypothetical protein